MVLNLPPPRHTQAQHASRALGFGSIQIVPLRGLRTFALLDQLGFIHTREMASRLSVLCTGSNDPVHCVLEAQGLSVVPELALPGGGAGAGLRAGGRPFPEACGAEQSRQARALD